MKASKKARLLIAATIAVVLIAACCMLIPLLTSPAAYDISPHILYDEDTVSISSPDEDTLLTLSVADGRLCYRVTRGDTVYMRDSAMGFTVDDTAYGAIESLDELGDITGEKRTDVRAVNGRTAEANAPCIQALIPVGDDGFTLEARVFDNGVAFRYLLDGEEDDTRSLQSEQTAFVLPKDSTVWAGESHKYYESINKYWAPDRYSMQNLGMPATVKLSDGGYAAVLEANLQHYPGIKMHWEAPYRYSADFESDGVYRLDGDITTPFRVISVADDLNELVNNTILYQVCDDADSALFEGDWVTPGRATWSWITGRTVDSVTPDAIETYTDYAAKLGFEYNIIDEGWVDWVNYRRKLEKLTEQGEQYGIGQILWTGVTAGAGFNGGLDNADDAIAYLDFVKGLNLAGAKIDFFTTENNIENGVDLYTAVLRHAAELELIINFHGCNKPTGLDATYPNELNREAILGLESTEIRNRKVQAQMFTTQPFVRNLAGHADFTPAVNDAFHMAQLVLTDAPMQAFGTDPKIILQSDALEMIKSVPTVWNQTVVLSQSAINRAALIAREGKNGSWYVGGINHMLDADDVTLQLSEFLGEGTYSYELWTDGKHGLEKQTGTVDSSDTLTVPFAALDGFIVRFDQATLSQYGGEINGDVSVDIADPDTTVRYTTDGNDATASSPVWNDGDTLTFDDSTVLSLYIDSPNGTYHARYRFNDLP